QAFLARGSVARVVEVDQRGVETTALQQRQRLGRRGGGLAGKAFGLEQQAQRLQHVRLVVRDQHAGGLAAAHAVAVCCPAGDIQPSNSSTVRPAIAAYSGLCVTWTMVMPSRFSSTNRSMIILPWLECSAPVGSSASSSLGR